MSIMSEYQKHGRIRKVRIRKIDDDFGEIIFGVLGFFMFWVTVICLLAANYY